MEAERDPETSPLGRTFTYEADRTSVLSKLSRYETTELGIVLANRGVPR